MPETVSSICEACLAKSKCRRYASNTRFGGKVVNCRPPKFQWNGNSVEGLYCRYDITKKVQPQEPPPG